MTIYENHIEPHLQASDGYQEVLDRIESYFKKDVNLTQSRYEFLNSRQQASSLENFMLALRSKVDECGFCKTCAESLTASTFLTGLDNSECRRHLLTKGVKATIVPDETLKLAKEFASSKHIETQLAATDAPLHALQDQRMRTRQNFWRQRNGSPRNLICGKGCGSHPAGQCRARFMTCHKCHRKGHFANVCESAHAIGNPDTDGDDDVERSDIITLHEARLDRTQNWK